MSAVDLWKTTTGGNRSVLGGGDVPVPLCLLQIQHGQAWDRTRASAHLRGVRNPCKACQDGRKSRVEDSKPASFEYE
jgi:hypothetical protein